MGHLTVLLIRHAENPEQAWPGPGVTVDGQEDDLVKDIRKQTDVVPVCRFDRDGEGQFRSVEQFCPWLISGDSASPMVRRAMTSGRNLKSRSILSRKSRSRILGRFD